MGPMPKASVANSSSCSRSARDQRQQLQRSPATPLSRSSSTPSRRQHTGERASEQPICTCSLASFLPFPSLPPVSLALAASGLLQLPDRGRRGGPRARARWPPAGRTPAPPPRREKAVTTHRQAQSAGQREGRPARCHWRRSARKQQQTRWRRPRWTWPEPWPWPWPCSPALACAPSGKGVPTTHRGAAAR